MCGIDTDDYVDIKYVSVGRSNLNKRGLGTRSCVNKRYARKGDWCMLDINIILCRVSLSLECPKEMGVITGIWNLELRGNSDPPRVVLDEKYGKFFFLEVGGLLGGGWDWGFSWGA